MNGLPALVVTADQRHGVTVAARDLASAVATATGIRLGVAAGALFGDHPPERAHLHFTDRLWASSPEDAAALVERIATRTALTVTLHDVPQASNGPRNRPRRTDCYARVAGAARGVVVNSRHEAAHLAEADIVPPGARRRAPARHPGTAGTSGAKRAVRRRRTRVLLPGQGPCGGPWRRWPASPPGRG